MRAFGAHPPKHVALDPPLVQAGEGSRYESKQGSKRHSMIVSLKTGEGSRQGGGCKQGQLRGPDKRDVKTWMDPGRGGAQAVEWLGT